MSKKITFRKINWKTPKSPKIVLKNNIIVYYHSITLSFNLCIVLSCLLYNFESVVCQFCCILCRPALQTEAHSNKTLPPPAMWVRFLFKPRSIPNRVFLRRCNALWDAGWRRSQDGSERQAEDRPCGGKALKKEVLDTERNPAKFARCRRRRGRLMDLARSQTATGWQKQSNIKSRMNSDEKEDCECAPPQAETSAAGGAYR